MKAIERIKGYCCEVTQEQWDELLSVGDEVGVTVYAHTEYNNVTQSYHKIASVKNGLNRIPFPDFLAKLKGEEKWEPKAGEMVEVSYSGFDWCNRKFIGKNEEYYIVYRESDKTYWSYELNQIRPLTTIITRAEAEQQLGKRVID
jgi:hypothetical protein